MRTLLRDFTAFFRAAKSELLLVWMMLAGFLIGGCTARGDEAVARAALALAKAKRDREALSCFTDYEDAVAEARRARKPLVLWVGVTCADHASLRRELADAIHCHVAVHGRDRTPRLVIPMADGTEWFVRAEKIGPDTAKRIREKWAGPPGPLLRPDVGISEEIGSVGGRRN